MTNSNRKSPAEKLCIILGQKVLKKIHRVILVVGRIVNCPGVTCLEHLPTARHLAGVAELHVGFHVVSHVVPGAHGPATNRATEGAVMLLYHAADHCVQI